MLYPTLGAYKIAVGSSFKNAVLDPELEGGKVRLNNRRQPLSYAGGYSIVFPIEVRRPGKSKTFALRCWKQKLEEGQERYQKIGSFLKKHSLPYFVDFEYIPNGIRVNGEFYPTTRMEWVEGKNLCKFVEQNLGDPKIFRTVADKFATMVKDLHDQGIAHGDLQAGNILLLQKGTDIEIKLIDYDSLYVPTLGNPSDRIRGLPEYQHPQRMVGPRTLNEKVDYFSELVIYLSFRSLAEKPVLWRRFVQNVDKRLIFSAEDFKAPGRSEIFQELAKMSTEVKQLALTLKTFCSERSINNLKPLEDVLPSFTFTSSSSSKVISKGSQATSKGPRRAGDYYNQGMTYLHGKQFSHAVQQFKKAIELNPEHKEAQYARGVAYFKMQQLQPAKKALEEALKISPHYIEAQKLLQEIERHIHWIKIDLKNRCEKAKEFCKRGNLKAARDEVENALRIDRNYKPALDLLQIINNRVLLQPRKKTDRIEDVLRSSQSSPFSSKAPPKGPKVPSKRSPTADNYYNQGMTYLHGKQFSHAVQQFKQAIDLNPDYKEAYYARGLAHFKMQQLQPAKKALEEALKISPHYIKAQKLLQEIEKEILYCHRKSGPLPKPRL